MTSDQEASIIDFWSSNCGKVIGVHVLLAV